MPRRSLLRTARLAALLALLVALPATAGADSVLAKNFHYFQPPSDGSGILTTYGSDALLMLGMHYGGFADVTFDHLTVILTDDSKESLIGNQVGVNLLYAIGLSRYLNLGLAFPFVAYRTLNEDRPDLTDDTRATSLEDLRIEAKGIILDRKRRCIGLAAVLTATIPLSGTDNSYLSDETVGVVPRLVFDIGRPWWTVAFNAGYRFGRETQSPVLDMEVRNELLFNLGATFRFARVHELMLDSQFRTPLNPFFGDDLFNYGELLAAYRIAFGSYSSWGITLGGGMGVLHGAGTPTARLFLGITANENRFVVSK